ncbi:putative tRNA (uracil-O(2)-)-methyltransferase [Chanos chanos]|uniref:tRNA (uracil-O(2)-)-methyltransferase n=1 Tax=Chanos chanos TaxID=29144 RepID=A0A6J2VUH0_CHACN|nr:probable tRNA (uracil-O(2)-)-methyltransferase [Chanos chanos]
MSKVFEVKFTDRCKVLPEGFWSAVEVWIKKPHVLNKRLCGVKETEDKNVDTEELEKHLCDLTCSGIQEWTEALSFLQAGTDEDHETAGRWCVAIRTIIPKVNTGGENLYKDIVVKDIARQAVTFLPFEQNAEGHILRNTNFYQIQLHLENTEEWVMSFNVQRPEEWYSDGVAYPKLTWLERELLPKLTRWATESKTSEFKSTLSLIPVDKYSLLYQKLKDKYKEMVKVWPEVTDPEKFVFEDVAIATYLLVLWGEERMQKGATSKQSFVDLGCGNGLLVHILTNEGHPGKGIDVRKRKIWDMYGPDTHLEETAITPSDSFLFPGTDWLIGNHSDELTPWIPVIAARSSYSCRYFVLPCCFFDFYVKYQRRHCKKTQYREYIDFISEVSTACGFNTEEDCLRIPSTKRVCLIGSSRSYREPDEALAENRRACYIRGRQVCAASTATTNHITHNIPNGCNHHRDGDGQEDLSPGSNWGSGFQPREKVESVRNCAALPRDFISAVVLRVANALLELSGEETEKTEEERGADAWNTGGSLSIREVAELLDQPTLQTLKKECGGLQTLLKNNHQVFRVESGRVRIRDWRVEVRGSDRREESKRKPLTAGAVKTRLCWFHTHHPQGCPLPSEDCAFAHGSRDLRPSTRPLKKLRN